MASRARIGITGPDRGGTSAWLMTAWAVRRCGGKPVRISPSRRYDITTLQGVIVGGGTDVDPFHYGQDRPVEEGSDDGIDSSLLDWLVGLAVGLLRLLFATHTRQGYDVERDQLEQHIIRHALYHDLPLLGICRGAQMMNVVLGGSLHQNIEHFYSEGTGNVRSILPRKHIAVAEASHLRQILHVDECRVNALHEQSIASLGEGVSVSATEGAGVIQAIERPEQAFFVGVQWHPEYMPQSARQLGLFRELLRNARSACE